MNNTLNAVIEDCQRLEKCDPVTRPMHYTEGAVECIDAIEAAIGDLAGVEAYLTGQALKYLWRWKWKGGVEDLKKGQWYLARLIARVEANEQ